MQWNPHYDLEGRHAYLGGSKHHWVNYDLDKLRRHYEKHRKAQEGTELHELAKMLILKRIRQVPNGKTFNSYVNDAIGFRMRPEQPLRFSDNIFCTPDAISFRENILRVHDLKTGEFPGHMNQLRIGAAVFFLEYGKLWRVKPHDVDIFLRIYQNDEVIEEHADPAVIAAIVEKAKLFEAEIERMKEVMM